MESPASAFARLVRPLTGAGALENAAKQTSQNQQLLRCDLVIFERTGQISASLIRLAQDDPDRLKQPDVPEGLMRALDKVLLRRDFESDISAYYRDGKMSDRLEVALGQPGYLEELGVPELITSELRSRLAHPSNR